MRLLPCVLAICLAAQAPAQAEAVDPSVVQQLEQFTRDLNEAMARRDRAALERLLAAEFHFVHAFGYADDKATFIAEAMEGRIPPAPPFRLTPAMRLYSDGNLVVVTNPNGGTASGTRAWATSVYTRRDGRWQLLLRQGTEMNPEPKVVALAPSELQSLVGRWIASDRQITTELRTDGLYVVSGRFPPRRMFPIGPDLFTTKVGGNIRVTRDASGRPNALSFDNRQGGATTYVRTAPAPPRPEEVSARQR